MSRSERKRRILLFFFWLACLAVGVLALLPTKYLQFWIFDIWDKIQHAGTFAVLALLGFGAYKSFERRVFIGLMCFGGGIEVVQAIVGWRQGDPLDFLADSVGLALAWLVWKRLNFKLVDK